MKNCLANKLKLDYSGFRGTPLQLSSSKEYIEKRKVGLQGLKTKHHSFDHLVSELEGSFRCHCRFEIRRFEEAGNDFFHSYGNYEIDLRAFKGEWKIISIKQLLKCNEGNRNIHGAFRS